jgi:hypothetical protein
MQKDGHAPLSMSHLTQHQGLLDPLALALFVDLPFLSAQEVL